MRRIELLIAPIWLRCASTQHQIVDLHYKANGNTNEAIIVRIIDVGKHVTHEDAET